MKNREGFTLLELMTVTVLIGILSTLAMSRFNAVRERGRTAAARSEVRNVMTASEAYRTFRGYYPAALADLSLEGLHQVSPNIDYCEFTREAGPPQDLTIEVAHRGSMIHLVAHYPSGGTSVQQVTAASDCS